MPAAEPAIPRTLAAQLPGFAIGLERWASRLTGAENVREVTLFPRDLHRLTP